VRALDALVNADIDALLRRGVEIKHPYDAAGAEEKRSVGKVRESRSGGKCLFVMPTEGDLSVIAKAMKQG
jgi:hypothetical protein